MQVSDSLQLVFIHFDSFKLYVYNFIFLTNCPLINYLSIGECTVLEDDGSFSITGGHFEPFY
jgi:hypothetical protein